MKRALLVGVALAAVILVFSLHQSAPMLSRPDRDLSIMVPAGYTVEKVLTGLTFPTAIAFDGRGAVYIAEAGWSYGPKAAEARILRIDSATAEGEVVASGLDGPVNGLTYHAGALYVSHRGRISRLEPDGRLTDLITGLPSWGDHHNNDLVFGGDGKLYFGQGTATNAGVVGNDNFVYGWAMAHPQFHDLPARDLELTGANFTTVDLRTPNPVDTTTTGAFSPFGTPTAPGQRVPGHTPASGTILRANADGSGLEVYAWGFRNPFGLAFDGEGRLWCTNHGYDDRGVRPVANAPDFLYQVMEGGWYGWPDFVGTEPITDPKFRSPTGPPLGFLTVGHPPVAAPAAAFPPHTAAMKLDFDRTGAFGHPGRAFVALFGDAAPATGPLRGAVGSRVVRVDPATGAVEDFAANSRPGRAGLRQSAFNRPIDVKFSPDGTVLYVLDFGVLETSDLTPNAIAGTGILWRIRRL
jgi:glucose/arabinose dehydrogenase